MSECNWPGCNADTSSQWLHPVSHNLSRNSKLGSDRGPLSLDILTLYALWSVPSSLIGIQLWSPHKARTDSEPHYDCSCLSYLCLLSSPGDTLFSCLVLGKGSSGCDDLRTTLEALIASWTRRPLLYCVFHCTLIFASPCRL